MLKKYEMVFISPIGPIGINSRNEKVSELKFNTSLKKIESKNIFLREVCRQLELYFKKKLYVFDVPYTIIGTNYQVRILKEVAKISYGNTITYSEIAKLNKTHPRPVGNACRNNPIQLLVPCHRVVGINNIGGFSGEDIKENGDMMFIKRSLLKLEK